MESKKDKLITFRVKVVDNKKFDWANTFIVMDKSENDFYLVNKKYCKACGIIVGRNYDITVTLDSKGYIDKIKRVH